MCVIDIERCLISCVIQDRDLKPIVNAHLGVDDFEDDEHRAVFEWISHHFAEYGDVPAAKTLHKHFPEYKLVRTDEAYQYYLDLKANDVRRVKLWDTLEEAGERYQDEDVTGTIKVLSAGLEELHAIDTTSVRINLNENMDERMERYEEMADLDADITGITTGFPTLDSITSGWQQEQLITLVGLPKVGKSTILMAMAIAAQEAGYTVRFFSFEMSAEEQWVRYDAMRARISFLALQTGRLTNGAQKRLQRAVEGSGDLPSFVLEHDPSSSLTVSGLGAKLAEDPADLVIVDGVYMMEAEIDAPQGSAQALTYITRGMKRLTMRQKSPIIQSTQVLYSKYTKAAGINMGSIGYTGSFGQDSDLVVGADLTDEQDVMKLSVVGARNAPMRTFYVHRDWETSTVEEYESDQSDWDETAGQTGDPV